MGQKEIIELLGDVLDDIINDTVEECANLGIALFKQLVKEGFDPLVTMHNIMSSSMIYVMQYSLVVALFLCSKSEEIEELISNKQLKNKLKELKSTIPPFIHS